MKPEFWNDEEKKALEKLLTDGEKMWLDQAENDREVQKMERLRPSYHFSAPSGGLNDPNGLCYWHGNWHMFYQNIRNKVLYWGHAVSSDLLHWRDLPIAFFPEKEKDCFSGMVLIEEDRAIAVYFGVGQGIMIGISTDPLLLHWKKLNDGFPAIPIEKPGDGYAVFDPCIWKNGDHYTLLSGRFVINPYSEKRERTEFCFTSEDLIHWKFQGSFLENDLFAIQGDDGACLSRIGRFR